MFDLKAIKNNRIYILYCFVYFILSWILFGAHISSFIFNIVLYGVSLLIAFSPVGEWILKHMNRTRDLKTNEEINYLMPIFEEVYNNALNTYPNLSKNIKLQLMEDVSINAFAFGKHTVAITTGAIETFSEDELRGVISHEFGHIAGGHTKALLLNVVGNGAFSIFPIFIRSILRFLIFVLALTNTGAHLLPKAMMFVFDIIVYIFNWIGRMILSINSRANEYSADEFASKLGYGAELLEALYLIKNINMNKSLSLKEKLQSSHPHIADRIGKLESGL